MKIERWGDNIVIPVSQQELLERGLSVGDEVDVKITDADTLAAEKAARRASMLENMRKFAQPLPPGYKFSRAEANGFEEE